MKLAARYGFVGLAALAALSLTHWARAHRPPESEVALYLLGVLPNLLAAVATPFVFLGVWADQNPGADYVEARRRLALATTLSTAGLVGWEFVQQNSRKLVFDLHDIGSTLVGACLAVGLFWLITPRAVSSPTTKQFSAEASRSHSLSYHARTVGVLRRISEKITTPGASAEFARRS